MTDKNAAKKFKGYPIRQIRMSEEVWKKLKIDKLKSGKTWNNFLRDLKHK